MPPIKTLPDYSVDVVSFLKTKGFRIQTDDGKYNLRSPEKKYYVFCYWDGDSNGNYCTRTQALDTVYDGASAEPDRQFKVIVYNVEDSLEVNVKITVTLE